MSSRTGNSKPRKGVRGFFREILAHSSSHPSGPSASSTSLPLQASASSGAPRAPNALSSVSCGPDALTVTGERPTTSHSLSAPSAIDSASAKSPSHPQTELVPGEKPAVIEHGDSSGSDTVTNTAWIALRTSLQALRDNPRVFFGLSIAAGVLLECFDGIETAARNQEDYESLAEELKALSDSLSEHSTTATPPLLTKCISNITSEVQRQADEIKQKSTRRKGGRFWVAKTDEEDVVRRYKGIESLFRQLQANLSMSTWSIANEHLANTRLKALKPVKEATYDSTLSSTVYRRKCTDGTRKKVLSDLDGWLYDTNSPKVYWMNGMAGTGKTTISCTFSALLEHHELLAASFFCTRTSADCRNATRIIPTIAYQLARYSIPFQSALYNILGREPDAGSKNTEKQFERLLRDPLLDIKESIPNNIVVVIDALDECGDPGIVEEVLSVLFRHASDIPLKFLITSRPEPGIYKRMNACVQSGAVVHLHDIESSLVQADIALYLQEELKSMSLKPPQIAQLVNQSGSLFIYAATLVRYIQSGERRSNPQRRLQFVLEMTPEASRRHAQIDALYTAVLKSALNEDEMEKEEMEDIRVVLRTVLFAQEPISIETVATLAGLPDTERVASALQPLRSVLNQSAQTGLVSTLHASFPDFMFSNERSGTYFCDIVEHSQVLAERCFVVMKEQLRFNICGLESSFVPDEKVDGLEERIKQRISPTLAYACRYWANHLALASMTDKLLAMLEGFIRYRLLFWMEVLSLRRAAVMCVETLLKTKQWLNQMARTSSELVGSVEDARNFVTSFAGSPVSQSTPHIYISSLPFCPRSSTVYKNYWPRTRGLLELKGSLMERRESAALATWNIGSRVWSVAYSHDGTRVAVGCRDNTVRILSAHDGTALFDPLSGHTDTVCSVAFSSDGKLLASGSDDKAIRVWNTYNGTLASGPSEGHTDVVYSVSFSPDGKRIVSGSRDNTICIWNTTDCALLNGPLSGHDSAVLCVTFSPDSTLIASGSYDNTVRLWKSHDGTPAAPPFTGHTHSIRSISFFLGGTRLVSGSDDKTIRVWSTSDGSLVTDPFEGHTGGINSVAVSPDGKRAASGSDDYTVRVWNIEDGTVVSGPLIGHNGQIWSVAFSQDGTRVISGSTDGTVRVWSVRDGLSSSAPLFEAHVSGLRSFILAENDTRILSSSDTLGIWAWDITPGELTPAPLDENRSFPPHPSFQSRNHLLTFAEDFTIVVSNITDGSIIAGPLSSHTDTIVSFAFHADDTRLVTASRDHTVCVWDLHKSALVGTPFRGHGGEVTSVAISSDHSRVISCSREDHTLRVWRTHSIVLPSSCLPDSLTGPSSNTEPGPAPEGWNIGIDSWVTNSTSTLLFWIPPDIASLHAWPSPHAEFIITKEGVLHIVQKELLVGDQWSKCFIAD